MLKISYINSCLTVLIKTNRAVLYTNSQTILDFFIFIDFNFFQILMHLNNNYTINYVVNFF